MKITDQLLTEASKCSLVNIQYIDLSYLNIARIQNLDSCVNLKILILKGNQLDCLYGLERCKQLWKLDVSNNRIKSLDGLSKFVALGSLNLSNNDFNWSELEKIRHLHIIDLIIFDNHKLDKDPNYRNHLVDSLPYTWMIDGLMVTSAERAQVEYFFEQSALTSKPVRKKLPKEQFVPTEYKTRDIYGEWTTKLLSKLPKNNIQNVEIDKKKLEFICDWFQELINIDLRTNNFQKQANQIKLKHVLEYRMLNNESCNMILVLLVASLEFSIPIKFMEETLEYLSLNYICIGNNKFETMDLFLLPKTSRIYVASILLSLAKLDRDQNLDINFYDHLFQSLHSILEEILRLSNLKSDDRATIDKTINLGLFKDHKSLLSAEITQLFCMIPSFYNHINTSEGLMIILDLSICDANIFDTIQNMLLECHRQKKTYEQITQEIGPFITNLLKINTKNLLNKKLKSKKPNSAFLNKSFHSVRSNGTPSLTEPEMISREKSNSFYERCPAIGDNVLIGPQCIGRIVTLPEPDISLVQFDYLLGINGSMGNYGQPGDHYLYANLKYFEWDEMKKFWRPIGSTGDRLTFQYNEDIYEKKLVWAMNSNARYMEEIKIEPLNVHNEPLSRELNDEIMELNFDITRSQDNSSVRSKNSDITSLKRNNSKTNGVQKVTKLELDVNIKNGFTPRTTALVTTNRTLTKKKLKINLDKEKENTQETQKSEFMRRWETTKSLGSKISVDDIDSPKLVKQPLLSPTIVTNSSQILASNSATNLNGSTHHKKILKKSNSYHMRPKTTGFQENHVERVHVMNDVENIYNNNHDENSSNKTIPTIDPDYQILDNSTLIDNTDEKNQPISNHQKYLREMLTSSQSISRPASPTISSTTYVNIRTPDRMERSSSLKKKNIKIQDCSSWLSGVLTPPTSQSKTYLDQTNRMRLIMGLKSTRASTNPKIPILTSPSSQAHELFRGLRPGHEMPDLCLNSTKLRIK